MPISPPSITVESQPHPALHYAGLRAEGLELLGRLCGDQWSDYNTHDPGITILEQLCFSLTQLAYRAQFPIEDLQASCGLDWQPAPEQILRGDPVTRDDLATLLRSLGAATVHVDGVSQPALPLYYRPRQHGLGDLDLDPSPAAIQQASVCPRGVLRIAAQFVAAAPIDSASAVHAAAERLHATRLLGRDYELVVDKPFLVFVRASLEAEPDGPPEPLMEAVYRRLEEGIRAAASGRQGLRTSDLIAALLTLPPVRQVRELALASNPEGPFHPWHLALPEGGAMLDPESSITLLHHGLPLACQPIRLPAAAPPPPSPAASHQPTGRRRRLTSQRSIARQLPVVYGVGPAGLPAGATTPRRAQARQLQAYLLLFDQLLANGQARLAQATTLLSPLPPGDPEVHASPAVSLASDPDLDLADLLRGALDQRQSWLREALQASTGAGLPERTAALGHLLSRFGEQLGLYQQLNGPEPPSLAALAADRSAFLRRIVPLTGGRGSGPDLLRPLPDAAEDEGQGLFAERLRRKLGLPATFEGQPPLLVIEHLLLRPLPEDRGQRVPEGEDPFPFLADVAHADPWSARVSVVIHEALLPAAGETTGAPSTFERFVQRTLREELPAHLAADLHWVRDDAGDAGAGDWSELLAAWQRFRLLLADYRRATLAGATPADPLLALRLRDSRDRLLTLLQIGLPWPLRDIPLPDSLMVASGQRSTITLPFSQPGVRYQLIQADTGKPVGEPAEGCGEALALATPPISKDTALRVQASVVIAPGATEVACSASGRQRTTLLNGQVLVVEGLDLSLSLVLLAESEQPLPLLHPEGQARLARFGQAIHVQVIDSQEGVSYQLVDARDRALPPAEQRQLGPSVLGTSGPILLPLRETADEDLDLAVCATLQRKRGSKALYQDQRVLNAILPLRVSANPAIPLVLESPVAEASGSATVCLGTDAPPTGSQASVTYQLHTRPIDDGAWLFSPPPAGGRALEVREAGRGIWIQPCGVGLDAFRAHPASGQGNGACLSIALGADAGECYVGAMARKQHRLSPCDSSDSRTHPSAVPLRQLAVLLVRPEAQRQLVLRREPSGTNVWTLLGGQPGVSYTVRPAGGQNATPLAPPLHTHHRQDAPGGVRGIERLRIEVDLVVDGVAGGPPPETFQVDPASLPGLTLTARRLLSGLETTMTIPPILVQMQPPMVAEGESARVVVQGLTPGRVGRLVQQATPLEPASADAKGFLLLTSAPFTVGAALAVSLEATAASASTPALPALTIPLTNLSP